MNTRAATSAVLSNLAPFLISFTIAFTAAWLVFNHFQHTIFASTNSSSSNDLAFFDSGDSDLYTPSSLAQTTPDNAGDTSGGCGCPGCCAAQTLPF